MTSQSATVSYQSWPLVGQSELGRHLVASLTVGSLPSVILFSGPAHLGKNTAARWLAQASLCTAQAPRPCGQCPACRQVLGNRHPRLNIFAAGQTLGVEEVRAVKGSVTLRLEPDEHHWIIFESVDRFTEAAANALLVFLEEPPPGLQIVMTTSRLDVIPTTVRSRAASYFWHLVSPQTLTRLPNAQPDLVHRAAGRPGLVFSPPEAEPSESDGDHAQMIRALLDGDPKATQQAIDQLGESPTSADLDQWELLLRELLLARLGIATRRLWPAQKIFSSPATSIAALVDRLERWQQRHQLLTHHVSAKFILADLLV